MCAAEGSWGQRVAIWSQGARLPVRNTPGGQGPNGAGHTAVSSVPLCGASTPYLDDYAGRLREVPQWDPEEADERRLGLVGLGAAGAQDAAAWGQTHVWVRATRRPTLRIYTEWLQMDSSPPTHPAQNSPLRHWFHSIQRADNPTRARPAARRAGLSSPTTGWWLSTDSCLFSQPSPAVIRQTNFRPPQPAPGYWLLQGHSKPLSCTLPSTEAHVMRPSS